MKHVFQSLFIFVLLSSCAPTPAPSPTSLPQVISECFLNRQAQVWNDTDMDGIFDPDEIPLSSIEVFIRAADQPNQFFQAKTTANGVAILNGIGDFGTHCDELTAEVSVPAGYTATTPPTIELKGKNPDEILLFGMVASTPTATVVSLRELPTRYPPMIPLPLDECPFISSSELEKILGLLTEKPVTMITFQPPFYENRASIRCEATVDSSAFYIDVWFAPDAATAKADLSEFKALTRGESIPVEGIGEEAVWWQDGLRMEAISGDARVTVAFASPIEESAHHAALLATQTIKALDPESASSPPDEIILPIGATDPETAFAQDFAPESGFFDACSLLSKEELEAVFHPLEYPLVSGGGIGELEPFEMYDCTTDALEPGGWLYYSVVFGSTPGDLILHYRRGAVTYPPGATPMENLGDEAWYWYSENGANLNLSVQRGNIMLVINVLMADGYENRGKLRSLARLILDQLFEPK